MWELKEKKKKKKPQNKTEKDILVNQRNYSDKKTTFNVDCVIFPHVKSSFSVTLEPCSCEEMVENGSKNMEPMEQKPNSTLK